MTQPSKTGAALAFGLASASAAALLAAFHLKRSRGQAEEKATEKEHRKLGKDPDEVEEEDEVEEAEAQGKSRPQKQQQKDKGRARLEWWQRLNEVKPRLILPAARGSQESAEDDGGCVIPDGPAPYIAVARMVAERLDKGRDWLVRDSDYRVDGPPAHSAVKAKVNAAIVKLVLDTFGGPTGLVRLLADPCNVILLLDTPNYGTLRALEAAVPHLRRCQQVVIPQADLRHYFEMIRGSEFYVGVRAQRVDHWLCANASQGLKCMITFLDYECRLAGARSARLNPAADVMRYFRFGFPAEPASVLAITVGLEEPAPTPEEVDCFVCHEAKLNGYRAELKQSWKYRMVTLLYLIHCDPKA